jgi:polyvinyl alcohol dehydrogenase (cytochrome)
MTSFQAHSTLHHKCRRPGIAVVAIFTAAWCAGAAVAQTAVPNGAATAGVDGKAVYEKRCSMCHDQQSDRIPNVSVLKLMPATRILRALDFGAMMNIASPMNRGERQAVANYIGTQEKDPGPKPEAFCANRTVTVADNAKFVWNGWSPSSDNARFEPAAVAGIGVNDVKNLKLKWAFGFEGDVTAFAPPTVIGDQIFVGSAAGSIYALKASTGCIQWVYQATGPVRSAVLVVPNGKTHIALFGDQTGWFYGIQAETGKELWKKRVEAHDVTRLTGAPVSHDGIVYVPVSAWEETRAGSNSDYPCCTFRGSLVALRVKDGTQVWKAYTVPEPKQTGTNPKGVGLWGPSGGSIWNSPTFDFKRKLIYVGTGDNFSDPATTTSDAVMALSMKGGAIVWSKQLTSNDVYPKGGGPDYDIGASVILAKTSAGKDILLAGQKSAMAFGLDADQQGAILWQIKVGRGGSNGGIQWGMSTDGRYLYAAVSDTAGTRTPGPDGTPVRKLDPTKGGGLTAIRIDDGTKAWFAPAPDCGDKPGCSPAQSAALTAVPGLVFSGAYDGVIRAYAAEDGSVMWQYDTLRDFKTVNGVKAHGGAMDGAGPVIVNGTMYVNSGYPRFGGLPGNVLLAFSADGK